MNILKTLRPYLYTIWIVLALSAGLLFPETLTHWGKLDLRSPWLILIIVQAVMFGMGTQMSLRDLKNIKSMKKGIIIGIISQFTIMPIVGFTLTKVFGFQPEISAGIILIGSCSSGLASNVMSYLSGANLPLSITLTTLATLIAPVMTPIWMKVFAGTYVEISIINMAVQIVKIIVVPVGAALLSDAFMNGNARLQKILKKIRIYTFLFFAGALILPYWTDLSKTAGILLELLAYLSGAYIFGLAYAFIRKWKPSIQKQMPRLSMFGIIYFTAVTTAASRENILTIGLLMFVAAILHNTLGYILGYHFAKWMGLDKNSCRTIAFEVGMQNGGMASGLAGVLGKLSTMGLAAAIFSPWMNFSGSLLANIWKKRPVKN